VESFKKHEMWRRGGKIQNLPKAHNPQKLTLNYKVSISNLP